VGADFTFTPFTSIGNPFQGGILAYVLQQSDPGFDPHNPHGLIIASEDLGKYAWAASDFPPRTFVVDKAIGAGMPNTEKLATSWSYIDAAKACYNLVLNGYDDWFLPSHDELVVLNSNSAVLGLKNGASDYYWSSTDANSCCNYAWTSFGYDYAGAGKIQSLDKDELHWVRPMRAF
jgi:hypothetical protein